MVDMIAVVGNSDKLLKKNYGGFIDSHDIVIRMNEAPTKGYEKYVGSKTDIRFVVFSERYYNYEKPEAKIIILYSYSEKMIKEGLKYFNKALILPQSFINECDSKVGRRNLFSKSLYRYKPISSVGFKAIHFALDMGKVDLFGFNFAEGKKFHYWEDLSKRDVKKWHDYEKEKQIIKGLDEITIY